MLTKKFFALALLLVFAMPVFAMDKDKKDDKKAVQKSELEKAAEAVAAFNAAAKKLHVAVEQAHDELKDLEEVKVDGLTDVQKAEHTTKLAAAKAKLVEAVTKLDVLQEKKAEEPKMEKTAAGYLTAPGFVVNNGWIKFAQKYPKTAGAVTMAAGVGVVYAVFRDQINGLVFGKEVAAEDNAF